MTNKEQKRQQLDAFFQGAEKRAFQTAKLALGNTDDALDIVQEAMLKLAQKYADKPPQEWGALFHRILHSRINDFYRRQSTRRSVFSWFTSKKEGDEDTADPIQEAQDPITPEPLRQLASDNLGKALCHALEQLPLRQRQAFMLRTWDGLNTADTAAAMQCSEGSVKTHYSRAMASLRALLEEHHD